MEEDQRSLKEENLHQDGQAIKMYLLVFFWQTSLLGEPQINQVHYKNFSSSPYLPLSFPSRHKPY